MYASKYMTEDKMIEDMIYMGRKKITGTCERGNHSSIPQRFQIAFSLPFASLLIHNPGSRGFNFSSPSRLKAARPRYE
jgi:hypothetical protein